MTSTSVNDGEQSHRIGLHNFLLRDLGEAIVGDLHLCRWLQLPLAGNVGCSAIQNDSVNAVNRGGGATSEQKPKRNKNDKWQT
jgi:hypothetical protein